MRAALVVDLPRKEFRAYRFDERTGRMEVREGIFESEVLEGFRLKVEGLWRRPLPNVVEVLKELGVI